MRPIDTPSSPLFPALDPIILDDDMESPYQDLNMGFLDPTRLQTSSGGAGREFDDLFSRTTASRVARDAESHLAPSELSTKRRYRDQDRDGLTQPHTVQADSPADTPDNSSRSSSSESPRDHVRTTSVASTNSAMRDNTTTDGRYHSDSWLNSDFGSLKEEPLFGLEADMPPLDGGFHMDTDIESSNKAMDSAFDFESAASSPSPLKMETSSLPKSQKIFKNQLRSPSNPPIQFTHSKIASPGTTSASPFYSHSSREASPMTSSMLPSQGRSSFKQWDGRSPSSALEETFGGINMNGGSPLSTTLSPSLNFGSNGLPFGLSEWPSEQTMAAQDFPTQSAPPNLRPEAPMRPILTVHPTSLKSRVETQIPIKMTLYPVPAGVKKLRLPSHTISKPKFLAKPDTERSPEILELHTSLVCTSAMQDQEKLKRAFARAAQGGRSSSVGQDNSESTPEEEKPLDGGEVKICAGCIQRERKRASRKKQRKPDEDELFQKDEEKRVIVFNTNEIKDWTEPSKSAVSGYSDMAASMVPAGAMQAELPMRIACYCRHQNEKLGFQVIFTIKDYQDNVIAQAITNSIMITDDHKTHAPPAPAPPPSSALPDGTQLPGAGVFVPNSNMDVGNASSGGQSSFRLSHSTTDLQGLQQRYSPQQYPLTSGAFVIPQNGVSGTSGSFSGRSLSRQASPSEFQAPSSKRRKHSGSIKLPSGLTMTKLEQSHSSSASASTSNGPHASGTRAFASPIERPFATPASLPGQFTNGPPTPNNNETNPFFNSTGQHGGLDSLTQQQLVSAPNSAHPSRPATPGGSGRNSFPDPTLNMNISSGPANSIWPSLTSTTNRLPSIIHKLVPAEGSTTGGTEVTLLGSGFYPGMEVVFGDTLATTTTFWGDKCLNCLTPPALQPGLVPVVFKHEHPTFGQPHQQNQPLIPKQQLFFRYVDDRELQMYRLALGILGQKLRSPADAFQTAQQIMGGDPTIWNLQNDFQGGSSGGHQRQVPGLGAQGKTSDMDSKMLTYLEFLDLDDNPRSPKYNMRSATGHSLLHFASSLGLTRFVAGLLARGANPDVQDNNGNTPMHLAALSGHAHIVHRLRLAGANADARSIRDFSPADLATTLTAHQAALIPARHYRSQSVGSSPSQRRRSHSTVSLNSLWETSSASGSLGYGVDDSSDSEDSEADSDDDPGHYRPSSRRSSIQQDATLYYTRSREGTIPTDGIQTPAETAGVEDTRSFSPPAALIAWRNHLATQINQFQQSVGRAFPNLPALPPMPALPDYQAHPMMRRITNLVPHRPTTSWSAKEGWWDLLTGNSSPNSTQPPAYEELYPHQEGNEEDLDTKKSSLVRAAADAAVDQHFEALETRASSSKSKPVKEEIKDIRIGRKTISREQQEQLRQQQARRMKGLGSDRNLYFFWIPVLLLVICAWLRNLLPGVWQGFSQGYELVKTRYGWSTEVGL